MSETNGTNGYHVTDDNGYPRDAKGKFAVGNPGGPGRPRGSLDLFKVCREKAKEHGYDLPELVWRAMLGMLLGGAGGDDKCAKLALDRLCGVIDGKGVEVNVSQQQGQVLASPGPPPPQGDEVRVYLEKLRELTEEHGLQKPGTVVDLAIESLKAEEPDGLEELLG